MRTMLLSVAAAMCLSGCASYEQADVPGLPPAVAAMEAAHHKPVYEAKPTVKADIDVDFGGKDLLAGTMWFEPWLGRVRMELDNGTVLVWDGEAAWRSPSDSEAIPIGGRFHLITWPYFMALPYKLSDAGVKYADAGVLPLTDEDSRPATKMTFGEGIGDAPDDWYLLFADPETDRLSAAGYIVTYGGTPAEQANTKPSIVFYDDYQDFDGVPFATTWTFYFWSPEAGRDAEPKGVAKLSNVEFGAAPAGAFDKPDDAVESKLMGAE